MAIRSELRRMLLQGAKAAPTYTQPEPDSDPWNSMAWWEKSLDILSRPTYASAGFARSLVTGQGDPLREAWRGFTGQKRYTYSDVLKAGGMDKGVGRATLGFVGDVLLDPTTYVSFGSGAGAKVAVKGVQKTLTPIAAAARLATAAKIETRLLEVIPKLNLASREALLHKTGLFLRGKDLPNETLAKLMAEKLTTDALGRAATGTAAGGRSLPTAMRPLRGLPEQEIFKPSMMRFAGAPIVKTSTLAAPIKGAYGVAKRLPLVGPLVRGAEAVVTKTGAALKKVFSTGTGIPEFDELVSASRDKMDRETFAVFSNRSKQWVEPLKAIRKEGGEAAYQKAIKEIRTYLEGSERIKKTPVFDATKLLEVDAHIAKIGQRLEDTKQLYQKSIAKRAEKAKGVEGMIEEAQAKLRGEAPTSKVGEIQKFFGAVPGPAVASTRDAKRLGKRIARQENRLRQQAYQAGDAILAAEFRSRGIAPKKGGIAGVEFLANIPRHWRKAGKTVQGVDAWISELVGRGALEHGATEDDFYKLIERVRTKPKKVTPAQMAPLAEEQVARQTAAKAEKLEKKIQQLRERKESLAGPSPDLDRRIKSLERELLEKEKLKKQIPTIMQETKEKFRKPPTDPRALAIAQSMERTFQEIWAAEKKNLPLPPGKLDYYFPHYMRDEVREMLVDVIKMDARKVLKPELTASLKEAQRRVTQGSVDSIYIDDLIESATLDPSKVRAELDSRGIHLTSDDMLVFEQNPTVAAMQRELNHIKAINAQEFAQEVLESPYFLKSKLAFRERDKIIQTLNQHPDHVLLIPTRDYIAHVVTPEVREAMHRGKHKEIVDSLYQQLDPRDVDALAKDVVLRHMQAYVIPREVAEHLSRAYTMQFNEKEIWAFFQMWDKGTGWWKAFATIWRPGFHTRNAFSNLWNMMVGGWKDPKTLFQSGALMVNPDSVAPIMGYTGRQILELADAYGVRKSGFIGTDIGEAIERVVSPSKNPLSVTGPVARAGSKVGSTIEDHARVAFFIDGLQQGMDPAASAMRVKKYLFDYKDLTKIEKGFFRRLLPFYTYTRKNLPMQIEAMAMRPSIILSLEKVRTEAEKNVENALERKFVSEWVRESLGIPFRRTADGKTEYFLMKGWVPTADLLKLDLDEVVGMLHPAVKAPLELLSNKNFFTGREIERFPGEMDKLLGVPMRRHMSQLLRNLVFLSQFDRMISKGFDNPSGAAFGFSTGINTYQQDKVVQMRGKVYELSKYIGDLKNQGELNSKRYGEDSIVTRQYEEEILRATAERDQVRGDLLQFAPDAFKENRTTSFMVDRLMKPKRQRPAPVSIQAMRRRAMPDLNRLMQPRKPQQVRGYGT